MKQRADRVAPEPPTSPDLAQSIEEALAKIPGVLCASVILVGQASVSEVHLVSSYAKRPKALVRDVESLLKAQFHLKVDYRCISVVQIPTEHDEPLSRRSLRFVSAGPTEQAPDLIECVLTLGGTRFRGAVTSADDSAKANAVAAGQATLQAAQWAYELDMPLRVQEAHLVDSAFCQVCVSIVEASTKHGQEMLTGTCFVVSDVCEAGSKSVLDAINRRLTYWVRAQALAVGG